MDLNNLKMTNHPLSPENTIKTTELIMHLNQLKKIKWRLVNLAKTKRYVGQDYIRWPPL